MPGEPMEVTLTRIDENVKRVDANVGRCSDEIEKMHNRLSEHCRVSSETHGKLWSAITRLRVRDAYVAGLMVALMIIFGAVLKWVIG